MQTKRFPSMLLAFSFLALASTGLAQNASISWYKIAGGGGSSANGPNTLSGTAGQWDAGNSSAGGAVLIGGFWGFSLLQGFTPGNLLVEGVGEGPAGLFNYAQLAWLEEVTTNGLLAQTKYMPTNYPRPTSASFNLMNQGDQNTDGYLTRSVNGQLACIPGYNATNREPNVMNTSTALVARVVGTLNFDGALDTSQAVGMFSSRNFYSVASVDGSGFWAVGETGTQGPCGLVYFQPNVATNSLTNGTFRCVKILNNQLFVSPQAGAGLAPGIYSVGSGLPTSGPTPLTQVLPLSGSPCQFEFNPPMTIAYVTDDGLGGTGGVKKYTYNGATWISNYTLTISGVGTSGARGLAADWSGVTPVIYATTAEVSSANRLVKIVDTGASASALTLATAPAGTGFRGVAWTPVQLYPPIIKQRRLVNQSFELTFGGTPTLTYRVLASSDVSSPLANWTVLSRGMFDANGGPVTYVDVGAAGQPFRFYRIASP